MTTTLPVCENCRKDLDFKLKVVSEVYNYATFNDDNKYWLSRYFCSTKCKKIYSVKQ